MKNISIVKVSQRDAGFCNFCLDESSTYIFVVKSAERMRHGLSTIEVRFCPQCLEEVGEKAFEIITGKVMRS